MTSPCTFYIQNDLSYQTKSPFPISKSCQLHLPGNMWKRCRDPVWNSYSEVTDPVFQNTKVLPWNFIPFTLSSSHLISQFSTLKSYFSQGHHIFTCCLYKSSSITLFIYPCLFFCIFSTFIVVSLS